MPQRSVFRGGVHNLRTGGRHKNPGEWAKAGSEKVLRSKNLGSGTPVLTQDQANFLLSPAAKDLKPGEASRLSRDEAYERFKEIRWGWQGGDPYCPFCGYKRVYEYRCREKFKCASCGRQFSVTSRTVFSSRKAEYSTLLHAIALHIHRPSNPYQMSQELGVQAKTSYRWAQMMRSFGLTSARPASPHEKQWPYLEHEETDAEAMLAKVARLLPKGLPHHIKADVGQDIIVGLLANDFTEVDLANQVDHYLRDHYKRIEWRFDTVSLDAPVPGTNGMAWADKLDSNITRF